MEKFRKVSDSVWDLVVEKFRKVSDSVWVLVLKAVIKEKTIKVITIITTSIVTQFTTFQF